MGAAKHPGGVTDLTGVCQPARQGLALILGSLYAWYKTRYMSVCLFHPLFTVEEWRLRKAKGTTLVIGGGA